MERRCRECQSAYKVTERDLEFYEKVSPVFNQKTYVVPPPTLCPPCRQQRRLSWRNERHLYQRASDLSGKKMISMYAPEAPYRVYEHDEWFRDDWDGCDYGIPFDETTSFFEQFAALMRRVPLINVLVSESENCSYMNHGWRNKNCYLACDIGGCEDVYYSQTIYNGKNCMDCMYCQNDCELCYECRDCQRCYDSAFLIECHECSSSRFCYDCRGCRNCLLCHNLRNKEYCIENKQYSKEEYEKRIANIHMSSWLELQSLQSAFEAMMRNDALHNATCSVRAEDCDGAFLTDCKDCKECFHCGGVESGAFLYDGASPGGRDYYDDDRSGWGAELCYETMGTPGPYRCIGVISCGDPKETYYSYFCHSPKNCFGCVGLKKKSYCILNTQYSKQEYENLVPRIIEQMQQRGEWGEFFPSSLSPFAYNESIASDFFPLSKEDVTNMNMRWRDEKDEIPQAVKIINASELPDKLSDIPDDVLNWAIRCKRSGKLYKIIHQELSLYRTMHVPLPRLHPDERHRTRMKMQNPRKLWDRSCTRCKQSIRTTYSPDRPETVLCEECYLKEVY